MADPTTTAATTQAAAPAAPVATQPTTAADPAATQTSAAPAASGSPFDPLALALIQAHAAFEAASKAREAAHDAAANWLKANRCSAPSGPVAVSNGHAWSLLNGKVSWVPVV